MAINRTDDQTSIDRVTLHVIGKRLDNIVDEMVRTMIRTAYSPIFSESQDFSCMLFTKDGEMISQAEMNSAIICAALHTVPATIDEIGIDNFEPGDVVIQNDPYRGSCHLPEHMLLRPIFHRGQLAGFAANIAHIAEIGGKAPGSFAADATDVFQEGLRVVPVKLMSRGEYVKDVWKLILANHRTPTNTLGDFHAMLASLAVAERRICELLDAYGVDFFRAVCVELLDYAERWMRNQIAELAEGEYTFADAMEDDGVGTEPIPIGVRILVRDHEVIVDYTESVRQAPGPINCTFVVSMAASYSGVLQALGVRDVPLNSGTFRPLHIIAPVGTVANVRYPGASVAGNTEMAPRIIGIVQAALGKALPERVSAADGGTSFNFLIGGMNPYTNAYYTCYLLDGVGWGGRPTQDGNSVTLNPNGNLCRNSPIEVTETLFPWVTLEYSMRTDSGGAGLSRGGLGARRVLRLVEGEAAVSALTDRTKFGAWGVHGGKPGAPGALLVRRKGEAEFRSFAEVFGTRSSSKFTNIRLTAGDEVALETPGGGGWGDPLQRDPAKVLADVQHRYVSVAAAGASYGVVIEQVDGRLELQADATARLRTEMRDG